MVLLYEIIDKLNSFGTSDLLNFINCQHHLPLLQSFFQKYQLGYLWDHLPAVLFFYVLFALTSGTSRVLTSLVFRGRLAGMDLKAQKKFRVSWAHHIVAFLNAVISSAMALHYILGKDRNTFKTGTHDYFPEVARILSLAIGYFLWDVQICLKYFSLYGFSFALHGVMALIALVISFQPYMMNLISYYMLVEISTIFLHINWFLIKLGFKESILFKISNSFLLLTYFIVRILIAPVFVYETFIQTIHPENHTATWAKVIYLGNVVILALLSQFWFWKLSYKTFIAPATKKTKTKTA